MKRLTCPLNGRRNITEFVCGGPAVQEPAPDAEDAAWLAHMHRDTPAGGTRWEWWCHTPTSYWFLVLRDLDRDEVLETRPPGDFEAVRP